MKVTNPYKCDYCDRLKGETNHWWLLFLDCSKLTWERREDDRAALTRRISGSSNFLLLSWSEADPDSEAKPKHICSESCAVKALNKWMAERKAVAQPQTVHYPIVGPFEE